jgi:leader peptidase (prepilin peptidase)/N-methyltransferase
MPVSLLVRLVGMPLLPMDSTLLPYLQAVFFITFLLTASVYDLKTRMIPDWLNLLIALTALLVFEPENLCGILTGLPFLIAAVFCGGMGGGDIKLMAAVGLVLGLPGGIMATILGLSAVLCFYGAARIFGYLRKKQASKCLPLAPFLSAGCIAAYFITKGGLLP